MQPSSPSPSSSSSFSPRSSSSPPRRRDDGRGAGVLSAARPAGATDEPATDRRRGAVTGSESSRPPPAGAAARPSSSPARRPVAGALRAARPRGRSASPAASSSTAASSTLMSLGLGGFGAACFVAFLWPKLGGGFGSQDHRRQDRRHPGRHRSGQRASSTSPTAASWITNYPAEALAEGQEGLHAAVLDRHGSRLRRRSTRSARTSVAACPSCATSQWFECPCHGSQYNRVGEKKGGPAPRGIDRFAVDGRRRRRHRRHRRRHPGPADRHQHHRPGGRRPALHHGRRAALMVYASGQPRSDRDRRSSRSSSIGWLVYAPQQPAPRHGPSSAPRSSWRPTASPTSTTRTLEGPRLERVAALGVCSCSSSSPSACRCTGSPSPAVRPGAVERLRRALRRVGRASCSTPRPTAASTAPAATAA